MLWRGAKNLHWSAGDKTTKVFRISWRLYFLEEINLFFPEIKDLEKLWIKLKQRISLSSVTTDFCISGISYFPVPH